jgi:ferredoxin/flavodoxin---NADP+ reductase
MSGLNDEMFDITIIGGGPTGLFTAFYGGMRKCRVKIIDSMPQLGGQLAALYPEKYIYDIAGFPKVRAEELVDSLIKQAMQFNPSFVLEECVLRLEKFEEGFEITTNKGTHFSKAIIITAGAGAFEPRRLKHPSAMNFEKENLHYFVNDLSKFTEKRVVILGGGDSALDWALMLEQIAKEVTIIHRRDKFRAHEHSVSELEKSSVNIVTPFEVKDIMGEDKIEQMVIYNNKTNEERVIQLDDLIVNYGFVTNLGPIKGWSLQFDKGSILVNSKMETNIPGIYAAGDICTYPGKVKLIAVGLGEAPLAVNNAKAFIDPDAKLQPGHSTSMDIYEQKVMVGNSI